MLNAELYGKTYPASVAMLMDAGIAHDDACALRRISMTLQRWHELECGGSNQWNSFCLVRGHKVDPWFDHDDNGTPFIETHPNNGGRTRYDAVPDRERGALKRLAKIMARYPGFASYVQGDPRGCALYILRPEDLAKVAPDVAPAMRASLDLSAVYSRGIAVHK